MSRNVSLRAVMFKSGNLWVGQCLEHDIAAEARTLKELFYQLERAIVGHLVIAKENNLDPFENVPKAPARFWRMFEKGLRVEPPRTHQLRVKGLSQPKFQELHLADPITT